MIIALQTLVFFRQSFFGALDRALQPYYKHFSLVFNRNGEDSEDEEADDQVFSEFDDEKGVIFFPPVYAQRYATVSDCLMDERWCGKLEKVVDFGYHDMSFIKYLKEVPGIQRILGVDLESIPLRCSSDLFGGDEYAPRRESPLQITLYQGNAADPDYRLIGCDAVIAIEMIEHMLPHDLDRFIHTVFGFIKPWIVVFTTPNGDFNVLFKSLEKNGLRRWDHFFEWSREQFHDWCSNIVVRYPLYAVTCQGIGPGPPGTLHHGCCSQLALFVNTDYQKQQDLDINSLALVPTVPDPNPLSDVINSWDSTENLKPAEIEPASSHAIQSYTEFLCNNNLSQITLVRTPFVCPSIPMYPTYSEEEILTTEDKISQCNLDTEFGKSFLMFDEEDCLTVLVPRRQVFNRVYMIEDVACRLNCSTLQVKRFSKTTQNLMAKNKIDTLVHTREVVDEIRHLTKTLNWHNGVHRPDNGAIWCNINWGDNAPYWNQYYKIVKEYNCPFETKSDECRILDLISDEINRMIDTQFEDELTSDANRLEIPLTHLMTVVQHLTDDVDKVKELLEWNGYEVVDDVVIHSRLVMDTTSVATHDEEWQDNDSFTDVITTKNKCSLNQNYELWDNVTEVRSTTGSEGSTIVPDIHDRGLRRALDHKVRNLRTMLTADEDITTELDKVVCKLMKLALRTSKRRTSPPPAKWMQCKLLDLLTLTEKAIGRRKKHFIESTLRAIDCGFIETNKQQIATLHIETKEDSIAKAIVDKYRQFISSPETDSENLQREQPQYQFHNMELEDDLVSTTSNEFLKELEFIDKLSTSTAAPEAVPCNPKPELEELSEITSMDRTKAWLNIDVKVPYCEQDVNFENSSGDTDSVSNVRQKKQKRPRYKTANSKDLKEKESPSKTSSNKFKSKREKKKRKSNTRVTKNGNVSSPVNNFSKNGGGRYTVNYDSYIVRSKKSSKEIQCLTMRTSKPIPESLIDFCQPVLTAEKGLEKINVLNNIEDVDNIIITNQTNPIAATKESLLIDIITSDAQETIALRRSIGTEVEYSAESFDKDQEELLSNDIDINLLTHHDVSKENIHSHTIFLNDINEPSTSKGIRRNVGMDVQCGPDTLAAYPTLSASTSLVRMSPAFTTGIKIQDVVTTAKVQGTDFGTSTNDSGNDKVVTPRLKAVGIKIKDSDVNICSAIESSTMIMALEKISADIRSRSPVPRSWSPESHNKPEKSISYNIPIDHSPIRTELLKPINSSLKTEDSGSDFCASVGSILKSSSPLANSSKNTSEILRSSEYRDSKVSKNSCANYNKTRLCCGGVHVHSYKDKQESEDIVYQGEWQRYRPNLTRKKVCSTVVAKKISDSSSRKLKDTTKVKIVSSKDKVSVNKAPKRESKVDKKPVQIRSARLNRAKHESPSKEADNVNPVLPKNLDTRNIKLTRPFKPITNVTKVASKITMSSINSKSVKSSYAAKKPKVMPSITDNKKEENTQKLKKSYIPLYMRRRKAEIIEEGKLNKSIDSANVDSKMKKDSFKNKIAPLVRSKTDDIKKDLLKFQATLPRATLMVFRNETKDGNNTSNEHDSDNTQNNGSNPTQNDCFSKRTLSPQSLNSSTCSSPNSTATVRAVNTKSKNSCYRKRSTSSPKSTNYTSESDNPTPTRTKRVVKRCKSAKRSDGYKESNKENLPDTTENITNKNVDKVTKSPFVGQHKSVCIAQLKTERSSTTGPLSRHKSLNKSNIKIPAPECNVKKQRSLSATPPASTKHNTSSNTTPNHVASSSSLNYANMVFVFKPQTQELVPELKIGTTDSEERSEENSLLTEWIQNSNFNISTNISHFMRQIIEDSLEFIHDSDDVHSGDRSYSPLTLPSNTNESVCSFKTVTADHNSSFAESDLENSLNRTFDNVLGDESIIGLTDTKVNVTDFDLLSFKSMTSVSKHSEYYLANSELTPSMLEKAQTSLVPTSVEDIFERKEPCLVQKSPGVIANQAFSGFSLDGEPITGDQPDPISLIDSETGSLAVGIARQTTSEELFISGRSSESYQSCLIDEDALVPNWLFQMISQQQSMVEDQPLIGPEPEPMPEPMYDVNGNMEGGIVGVAAGAGDGRGIHSDQSQDSSGRGTSLSSTDTSSSPESETIVMDPSTFTAQFEMMRDPISSGMVQGESVQVSSTDENFRENDSLIVRGYSHRARRNAVSDIDADISSIDTDVPDSSDN
ncbi:hen1 methyltransferase [Anticarsia gemmatalis]|uniref:hen1 methyltransferase n=1 Tax=Anticarsia gemmatalis TaxID=129554 RepID=UPI003F759905